MKVLVVSHNVFSKTSNMGKTMTSYFRGWNKGDIAQFYIHSEVPTDDEVCENYYRVTDKEMLKSFLTRKSGTVLAKDDIQRERADSRMDTGTTAQIYQRGRSRTPFIFFARNLIWRLGCWYTKKLKAWLDNFSPDVLVFVSGDYSFMYKIARKIAVKRHIPLYVVCVDDYYFNNKNEHMLGGKWQHKSYMRQVKKTMNASTAIFSICDKMSVDYAAFFKKPTYTLHTGSQIDKPLDCKKTNRIVYMGNLGYERYKQLVSIGRALLSVRAEGKPPYIEVYSAEPRPEILAHLTEENGIRFCGAVDADTVKALMGSSMLLIHTESFDEEIKKTIAYSVSTKIADSLSSGTCLLAYGPRGIASMDYLIDNQAAFCITESDDLTMMLDEIISSADKREEIVQRALALAQRNHLGEKGAAVVKSVLISE